MKDFFESLEHIKINIVKSQLTVKYHQANNVEERNTASGRWSAKTKIPSRSQLAEALYPASELSHIIMLICHLQMLKPTQVKTRGSSMQGCQSPMSSQILRIGREGMIDDVIKHGTCTTLFVQKNTHGLRSSQNICDDTKRVKRMLLAL